MGVPQPTGPRLSPRSRVPVQSGIWGDLSGTTEHPAWLQAVTAWSLPLNTLPLWALPTTADGQSVVVVEQHPDT